MSALTGIAQRIKPVWSLRKSTFVLGAAEVREVFRRADCFELGPVASEKMLSGKFLLGMDQWPVYVQDKDILRSVLDICAWQHLQEITDKHCKHALSELAEKIEAARSSNQLRTIDIDLVEEFAEPVVTRIAAEFFLGRKKIEGLSSEIVETNSSRLSMTEDEQIFSQWLRKIGSVIATNYPAQFGLQGIAEAMSKELTSELLVQCKEELEKIEADDADDPDPPNGVTGRLTVEKCESLMAKHKNVITGLVREFLKANPPGNGVAPDGWEQSLEKREQVVLRSQRNVAGLMMAGSTPIIHSFAVAMDQLLQRPDVMNERIPMMLPVFDHSSSGLFSSMDDVDSSNADIPDVAADVKASVDEKFKDNGVKSVAIRYMEASQPVDAASKALRSMIKTFEERPGGLSNLTKDNRKTIAAARRELGRALVFRGRFEKQMNHLVFEAMRFNPTFPFLARYCPRHEVIRGTTPEPMAVSAGSTVVASQLAAMHDSNVFPNSETFAYRPRRTYMHFGYGGHACIGRTIATKVISQLLLHVMQLPGIEHSRPSKLRYDGPAVCGYRITLQLPDAERT